MRRRSCSTDFSESDFQASIDNFPLPSNKNLVIDRRLESLSDPAQETHVATHKGSISSGSVSGRTPGPLLPPSPADSTSPIHPSSRGRNFSVGGAIESGDASRDKEHAIMRNIDRGTPGEGGMFLESRSPAQKEVARRKSQYYENAFAQRESSTSPRERVSRESMVMADVRTNVIVQDEYMFITDLSYTLSSRYARPDSSICVSITHSACLLFGGSFEPAYTMTITALPSLVQPTTNKRNAALIQKSMEDVLGVPPQRGLIRFVPVAEENLAINGRTVLGEIEEMERVSKEELHSSGLKNGQEPKSSGNKIFSARAGKEAKNTGRRASMKSLSNLKTGKGMDRLDAQEEMPPLTGITETPGNAGIHEQRSPSRNGMEMATGGDAETANTYGILMPAEPAEKSAMDRKAEKAQKLGKRRSFIAAVFGKAG